MDKASFNKSNFIEFKKLYEETPKGGIFVFEGHELLKEYAGYLIQFIQADMPKDPLEEYKINLN